jgi:hypothetical protein
VDDPALTPAEVRYSIYRLPQDEKRSWPEQCKCKAVMQRLGIARPGTSRRRWKGGWKRGFPLHWENPVNRHGSAEKLGVWREGRKGTEGKDRKKGVMKDKVRKGRKGESLLS